MTREEAKELLIHILMTYEPRDQYGDLSDSQPYEEAMTMAIEALSDEPTGKWVLDPNGMDWNLSAWRCSECGFVATHIGVKPNGLGGSPLTWAGSKFCPQCGVKIIGYMKGENK